MQSIEAMNETAPVAETPEGAATPLRRCIATGESLPPEKLIRFVVAPDDTLTPDIERRLPGRGMWVTAEKAAVEQAMAKNLFARAARRKIVVPEDLLQRLQSLVLQRVLDTLGQARRAGQAVAGHDKVREFVGHKRAGLMLFASDAGADARSKIGALAQGLPVIEALDALEQGAAFSRDQAVFVAVAPGRLAQRLKMDLVRLQGVRGLPTAPPEQV